MPTTSPDPTANLGDTPDGARTPQARAAIAYARRGWCVFPCVPGRKEPLTLNGFHAATCDPDAVAAWWRTTPRANVALVPGRSPCAHDGVPGTLLILDLDGPLGRDTAAALGVPDDGPTVTTGRVDGGAHRYFWLPLKHDGASLAIGNAKLGPGLDVRHARGYVLAPPSVHPSGAVYAWWRDGAPGPLPPAVLDRLTRHRRPPPAAPRSATPVRCAVGGAGLWPAGAAALRRAASYLARVPHGLADGDGRNATAWRIAAVCLHTFGLGPADTGAALAAWDAVNRPPLGGAVLARVLDNAERYGARRTTTGARAA